MSKSFDFSKGLSSLNLSTAAVEACDDDSVESMTRNAITRNSTRSGGSGTTVTDLFASPRSHLSTGSSVGGGKGNTKDKVKLFYVENSQNYCCGIVGSGGSSNRACIKTAGGCTISKHQGAKSKFNLTDNTLYIKGPGSERILVTPSIHRDMVRSDEVWSQLVSTENTIEVWRAELEGIAARHTRTTSGVLNIDTELQEEDEWSTIGSPGTTRIQTASEEMATPTGAELNDVLQQIEGKDDAFDDEGTLGSLERFNSTLTELNDLEYTDLNRMQPDEGPSLEIILSEWRFVVSNFKVIVQQLERFKTNQQGHKSGLVDGLNRMNKKIKLTDTKAHIISSKIGDDLVLSDGGSKTVWQVLTELSGEIKEVMGTGIAYNQSLTDTCTDLTIKNDSLVDGLIEFKTHHVTTIQKVFEEFRKTNTEVAKLKRESNRTSFGPATNATVDPFDMRRINDRFDNLKGRIETLEEKMRNSTVNGGSGSGLHARTTNSTVEEDLLTLEDRLDHEVANLKRKLHDMERNPRDEGKPFTIGTFTFTCPADLESSLYDQDGFKDPDIGCCWELMAAAECMVSKGHDGKERADERYSAMRVASTVNSNDMMATMDLELPTTLFAAKKGGVTSREKELKACPTHAKWQGNGRDSFQMWFSEKLEGFKRQVYGTIPNDGGPGARLADLLCGQLTQQWSHISRFIDATYRSLVDISGFTDKATWELIGRYLAAIFGDMSKYRIPVARLHPDSRENQIKILWAIIQCHRVVQEFIQEEFNSHPSIVAEIGLFILTERVDPSRISNLEKKLAAMTETNTSLNSTVKDIKKELEQLKESAKKDRQNWKNELSQAVIKLSKG